MGSVIPLSSILSKATERQVEGTYIPPSGLRKVQREEARGKARAIRKPAVRVQAANQQLISEDNLKGSTMYHTHVYVCVAFVHALDILGLQAGRHGGAGLTMEF